MRTRSPHPGRSLFLLFIAAAYGAIFMAAPLVSALEPQHGSILAQAARNGGSASAGSSTQGLQLRQPTFQQCDRNKDGLLDKSEAAAVPGLSAHFERADANKDGRLDQVEFGRALAQLDAGR